MDDNFINKILNGDHLRDIGISEDIIQEAIKYSKANPLSPEILKDIKKIKIGESIMSEQLELDLVPSVTKDQIDALIKNVSYLNVGEALRASNQVATEGTHLLTQCFITLENGFVVSGESSCVHPSKYNKEIGEKVAYENAYQKIWMLEGYFLKQILFEEQQETNEES